eukprot:s1701_g17.t1
MIQRRSIACDTIDQPFGVGGVTFAMPRPKALGGVTVGPSTIPGAGMGLFAAEDLPKYQVIGEYSGEVKSYARFGEKVDRLGHNHLHPFYLKPGLIVDPTDEEGALDPASLLGCQETSHVRRVNLGWENEGKCGRKSIHNYQLFC